MMINKRKTFTKEFKLEAVRLLETGDQTGIAVARELGIKRNQLYKWRDELSTKGESAFNGPGRRPSDQGDQVAQLKKENARLKEELEILKKAAAYFARELK
jgi:transposase